MLVYLHEYLFSIWYEGATWVAESFTCSILLLLLLLQYYFSGSLPFKVNVFVTLFEIFSPYLEVAVFSFCTDICTALLNPPVPVGRPRTQFLMSSVLDISIPFTSLSVHSAILYTVQCGRRSAELLRNELLLIMGMLGVGNVACVGERGKGWIGGV